MLPPTLPLFPLPSVVLFPNVFLPLHIFEARYRQLVSDALGGDRLIGMVLLQPGYEAEYERRPAVYPVGCAGLITHVERLPDGRFNLVLRGLERFRIVGEERPSTSVLYRRALVAPLEEPETAAASALKTERRRLEALLTPLAGEGEGAGRLPAAMPDEDLINALAQFLELEPIEKLALLECDDPLARARSLVELLEMKAIGDRAVQPEGRIH